MELDKFGISSGIPDVCAFDLDHQINIKIQIERFQFFDRYTVFKFKF